MRRTDRPRQGTSGKNILSAAGPRHPGSTLVLEDAAEPGAAAGASEVGAHRRLPNVGIAWAGALSVSAHVLAFVLIGVAAVESTHPSSAPELRVTLVRDDGRSDLEHDRAGPVEAPAAPTPSPHEELLSATRPVPHAQLRVALRGTPAPALAETAAGAVSSGESALAGEAPPASVEVVTTTAARDRAADAHATAAAERPDIAIPIPTSQQARLSRWVMQAARSLQDANLRRAELALQHEGRRYVAQLERRPAADSMGIERLTVAITTEADGRRLRTAFQMQRLAFSHFAQLVDNWDSGVQFHDDEIIGRFHSNSEIAVGYDLSVAPRFLGIVTTAARGFRVANTVGYRRGDEIFRAGIDTRAGSIALPEKLWPRVAQAGTGDAVHTFARSTRITFYPDGSYGWCELRASDPEHRQPLATPAYLVAAGNAEIRLRGTLHGKVLVYSPERIVIEGSVVYAHDPRELPDADDYLGLVSGRDVEIARPEVTGPGDLEVHAAIYARRRFVVTDEDAPRHGRLLIHGSVTAGSISATEPRYSTRYEYDRRFENQRPPGFPETDQYEIESWDTQWREAAAEPPEAEAAARR